eukprot:241610_1
MATSSTTSTYHPLSYTRTILSHKTHRSTTRATSTSPSLNTNTISSLSGAVFPIKPLPFTPPYIVEDDEAYPPLPPPVPRTDVDAEEMHGDEEWRYNKGWVKVKQPSLLIQSGYSSEDEVGCIISRGAIGRTCPIPTF